MSRDHSSLPRWRTVLGREYAERHGLGSGAGGAEMGELERAGELLDFLFADSEGSNKQGASQSGGLTVAHWVQEVRELFPHSAKEVLEGELVRRRGIGELLSQPDLLERIEPNVELVKTLISHRDLLNPETRVLARKIIDQVVAELREKLKLQVEPALIGALRRDRHSPRHVARNLDLKTTVRRNLRHWDAASERLLVERLYFHAAERKQRPWNIIIAVDQSGSMLDSAIFSAIMASIFAELPTLKTSLFLFDTRIADLTEQVGQPVDVLMQVQLGGGTDIGMAMAYAATLVREPARSIVVLITDFYEGGDAASLVRNVAELCEAGVRCVGLGALGYDARPQYDKAMAKRCRKVGMDILLCTPERLAEAMAEIIRG
ncbi:VWA domain-containing protein [Pseudomarimonas arenosa]|uniref:VWA domain-containing protein n=1 Tax=Pseudomarimonas arenosa TaxID=2774145 RepID=A0AAW3ZPC5_9GAMM|nr:VWA domain-containing protein [Pseudomarimonas arenosa]MBD8528015.1 VWA domain-containing protein [Pseudomarimonas arenosa]